MYAPAPTIRPARHTDLPAIVDLYNHFIRETVVTFDVTPYTVETRRPWFGQFAETGPHRLLVAEEDGRLLGYVASFPHLPKAAYERTAETSIYLAPDAGGRGLGRALYGALFEALAETALHRLLAGVTLPNPASEKLHVAMGFEPCAFYSEVGYKFGRYWNTRWFLRKL